MENNKNNEENNYEIEEISFLSLSSTSPLSPLSSNSSNNDRNRLLLEEIGKLRFKVWKDEGSINLNQFPNEIWIDNLDEFAIHYLIKVNNQLVASARLTLHTSFDDNSRDVQLWKNVGKDLPLPTTDLGRLVVLKEYRGKGFAKLLNEIRINKAREIGAKSIMVTASEGNKVILCRNFGFEDIGERVYFDDRPNTLFYALQLNL